MCFVAGILLMAGQGRRFSHDLPKQFHLLKEKPVYQWALQTFIDSKLFDAILLVVASDQIARVKKEVPPEIQVVEGGATRQESSFKGIQACAEHTDIVVIHDAVRPFVSKKILKENIEKAKIFGAVNTCISSADTLVHSPDGKTIQAIPKRSEYMRGQTPQTFSYSLIKEAHEKLSHTHATDDCSLVLKLGHTIYIVNGDEHNHKITTQMDLQQFSLVE